jgi:hypothetical protein
VGKGILLIAFGIVFTLSGIVLASDAWGMTRRYYRFTIRSWQKISFSNWAQRTPYCKFRLYASLPGLMGIFLIAVGIHFIGTSV